MKRLAFFASHNGSSAKAIVEACRKNIIPATPVLMISNNRNSHALKWAGEENLETLCLNVKNQGSDKGLDQAIANALKEHSIDTVICSGYMKLIGPETIAAVNDHILNVHPALLPKYGGQGMYGRHVHEAVIQNGDTQTGITIHLVDGEYDRGRILDQKRIAVTPDDTAESVETKVKEAEPAFYIQVLQNLFT